MYTFAKSTATQVGAGTAGLSRQLFDAWGPRLANRDVLSFVIELGSQRGKNDRWVNIMCALLSL